MEYIIDLGQSAVSILKDTHGRIWLTVTEHDGSIRALGLEPAEAVRIRDAIDEVIRNG